jgi:hypothetical protein
MNAEMRTDFSHGVGTGKIRPSHRVGDFARSFEKADQSTDFQIAMIWHDASH